MLRISAWLWMVIVVFQSQVVASFNYCKLKCPLFDPPFGAVLLPGPSKNQFYKCNFGAGILFKCSRRTHFNPRKKVCDWPWRARAVVCHGSPDYEGEGSGDDDIYMEESKRPESLYDINRKTRNDLLSKGNKQKRKRIKILNKKCFSNMRTCNLSKERKKTLP